MLNIYTLYCQVQCSNIGVKRRRRCVTCDMKALEGDAGALKGDREDLNGNMEVLTGDEEALKGDREALTCNERRECDGVR